MKPLNSSRKILLTGAAVIATSLSLALFNYSSSSHAQEAVKPEASSNATSVRYHTVSIDGVDVFYREAGRKDAPAVLLLHGFPTSSHMYRNLIPALADKYRVSEEHVGLAHHRAQPTHLEHQPLDHQRPAFWIL